MPRRRITLFLSYPLRSGTSYDQIGLNVNYCVAPVRWAQRWLVPPSGSETTDWRRVSFQPMLYLFLFLGAIFILFFGDPFAQPSDYGEPDTLFLVWDGLGIICPPLALLSLWLIVRAPPKWKYIGFWTRLTADVGMLSSLMSYCVLRLSFGDFHIIPIACLLAATLFVFHLVIRDIRTLREVEKLASVLHRKAWDARD